MEEALKEEAKALEEIDLSEQENILLNPDTDFADKFSAVITDMLEGKHITQAGPGDTSLNYNPVDNEDDEKPTQEF